MKQVRYRFNDVSPEEDYMQCAGKNETNTKVLNVQITYIAVIRNKLF
jgi:hypothetical protein